MNSEIIAIGNPTKIHKIVKEFTFTEDNEVFVISVPTFRLKSVLSMLANDSIKAFTYKQYQRILETTQKFEPLEEIDREKSFEWLRTGNEYFHCTYANSFEICSIDKKTVNVVTKVEPVGKCFMSNNGAIYGFANGSSASFHIEDSLKKIFDMKLDDPIELISYSEDDSFVALHCKEDVLIYDLFKGIQVVSFPNQPFSFFKNSLYFRDCDTLIDLNDSDFSGKLQSLSMKEETRSFSQYDHNRIARFEDGPIQKVIYDNLGSATVKTHTYTTKIEFHFAETRLYALITKSIGKTEHFIIESYLNGEITSLPLGFNPIAISVSDKTFVVQDEEYTVSIYSKEKYTFRKLKTIKKRCPQLISIRSNVCILYDKDLSTIEFYDKGTLRSAFNQNTCTDISWSKSGLYVSAFSCSTSSGGLMQIFNINGQLMYKKIYSCLSKFSWRSFVDIDLETKIDILKNHEDEFVEDEIDEQKDTSDLLAEWKAYLLSKIQINSK